MAYHDWLPTSWLQHKDGNSEPLVSLRKQVDSLFDDFDRGFWARSADFAVRSNISETDKEVCITAELPGMTEDDIDVSVAGNRITVKGQKKSETEERKDEEGRQFLQVERMSGAFQRSIALPFDIDGDAVTAKVKDGVLTVTVPKPAEVAQNTKKIEVSRSN
ncbi:Hsp20/alpha crystallin family protein [Aliishimia ponticola]|uniref:Hsp20/alpha crystallin family protein n=1 Tax=Aliishimia ponticola TaxID=2499833 RepID=A0A4S4NFI8_9RHOB|nr:Hsp20/alpha crystallin family protein [Aliishimia ponticola]THH36891.1 Hsp20/alpha crystallin family protein [Aliishimia ponticola]